MPAPLQVVVVGGGVAGIAAATALADSGLKVTLLEKRPLLGGRASSYVEPGTGERLDECQHGTMRCCTNLAALLDQLGVHDQIQYEDTIQYLDSDGQTSYIRGSRLPAPFHTAPSFLALKFLNLFEKVKVGQALSRILMTHPGKAEERETMAVWLQRLHQPERVISRFWRPILVSACNEEPERISCWHAFTLFRNGFLLNARAFHFGVPQIPLGSLYTEPTVRYLESRGGVVRVRTIVDTFHFDQKQGHVTGVRLSNGEILSADAVVSALQFDLLRKALPTGYPADPVWDRLEQIELAPLMGVHLWFEGELKLPPALSILDREIEWIFRKPFGHAPGETYLSLVISASNRYAGMPKVEILERMLCDLRAVLPEIETHTLLRSKIIRWPKATISPLPGVEALRPDQRSPLPGLYLAGEWTNTGWPSTMEGAARSGYLAAERLLEDFGTPRTLLVPDLPITGIARLFA